jgi:hypothetical protein
MYEPTSTSRQRSMVWDPAPVDGPPDRALRHDGGVHRAWILPGIGIICPSLFIWQHRDPSKLQNLFCSRYYWRFYSGWAGAYVRNVFPLCFNRQHAYCSYMGYVLLELLKEETPL